MILAGVTAGCALLGLSAGMAIDTDKELLIADLIKGVHLCGLPGTGKTWWILYIIKKLRQREHGVIFIDIHDSCRELMKYLDPEEEPVYIAPWSEWIIGINTLGRMSWDSDERYRVADANQLQFHRLFAGSWGDVISDLVYYSTLAVMEWSEGDRVDVTILEVLRFLTEPDYMKFILRGVHNDIVRKFWSSCDLKSSSIQSAIRKFSRALVHESLFATLANSNGVNILEAMNQKKLVLFDFDSSKLGEATASFLAGLILSKVQNAALTRDRSDPFCLVVCDEFPSYSNDSLEILVAQCRKKNVALCLANQSIKAQLSSKMQSAVDEMATRYYFRLSPEDAPGAAKVCGTRKRGYMERFIDKKNHALREKAFEAEDFIDLPNYYTICRELVKGVPRNPRKRKLPGLGEPTSEPKVLMSRSSENNNAISRIEAFSKIQSRLNTDLDIARFSDDDFDGGDD
jgi:hypothetical protein